MIPTARVFLIPRYFSRVAWSILECARRTSTFLSCAFREQENDQVILPYPSEAARCASTGIVPATPLPFSAS